ncbi:MAG: histone H1 [Solirubrobacterales bacterium]|nr:histone H1 [Solirubrobacterales bacterium]
MPDRSRKRPRDPSQLGKLIVDIAVGEIKDPDPNTGKDPAAVALGRKGGMKGGKARAAKLTADERSASARKAAQARWQKARHPTTDR